VYENAENRYPTTTKMSSAFTVKMVEAALKRCTLCPHRLTTVVLVLRHLLSFVLFIVHI